MYKDFTISITTYNRLTELKLTLQTLQPYIELGVRHVICDDGSTDGTSDFLIKFYPEIKLLRNATNRGLIYSRNRIMEEVTTSYLISLDDDAHFLSDNVLQTAKSYFEQKPECGVIACRVYWGIEPPSTTSTVESSQRVQGFVGCGHIWRMLAWGDIPNYPEWFKFYGEEEFASFHLFKRSWEVHYLPEIFVQHRVEVKARKKDSDYRLRLRRSLRSGWYLYLIFFPWPDIPKRFIYTLWVQIKLKVFKGDWNAFLAILKAVADVLLNAPRIFRNRRNLTQRELCEFSNLPKTKLYWNPNT